MATHYGFIDKGQMVKEICAQDLENVCRKCVRIEVSDIKALSTTLDNMKVEYNIISDSVADVFAKLSVSKLAHEMEKVNCEIISMQERDESLESYYINLVGGATHE